MTAGLTGPSRTHANLSCTEPSARPKHRLRSGDGPLSVRGCPSTVKGTRRSFLTASQKGSSGPTLERRSLCTPSVQKPRARREPARTGRGPSPARCARQRGDSLASRHAFGDQDGDLGLLRCTCPRTLLGYRAGLGCRRGLHAGQGICRGRWLGRPQHVVQPGARVHCSSSNSRKVAIRRAESPYLIPPAGRY
jgi:hypothetical protein